MERTHWTSTRAPVYKHTLNRINAISAPTNITHREKNFSLNLEKALENKMLATKRDIQFEYHCTCGGIVGSMDAITFELVKNVIPRYYEIINIDNRRAEVTNNIDKNGLNLSKVFKLHENYQHQYTLTLYNTKCTFLVNGKGTNIFIEKDLPNIHKIIKDVTLNVNRINIKNWNEKLEKELMKLKSTQEQIGVKFAIPDNTVENQNAKCFKCNRNVQSRAVLCDKGQQWVHYRCLKLNSDEIRLLETQDRNEDYTCKLCVEIIDTSQSKSRTIQNVAEGSDTVTYKQLTSAHAMLDEELILIQSLT